MNENEIALYLADRMKLMSDYSKGILQSPQAKQMAEYLIKSGGRLPQDFNYIAKPTAQFIQNNTARSLAPIASNLFRGANIGALIYQGLSKPANANEFQNDIRAIYPNGDFNNPIFYNHNTGRLVE